MIGKFLFYLGFGDESQVVVFEILEAELEMEIIAVVDVFARADEEFPIALLPESWSRVWRIRNFIVSLRDLGDTFFGGPMETRKERYHKIGPLELTMRSAIAIEAIKFFSLSNYREKCKTLGKEPEKDKIRPFTGGEFLKYMELQGTLVKPRQYLDRIRELLDSLESAGILTAQGFGSDPTIPKYYYFQLELSSAQEQGIAWLAPALGDDFLYWMARRSIVHITGTNKNGDERGGTGVVIDKQHILTCAHVINEMKVDRSQKFRNGEITVIREFTHPTIDIGILQIKETMFVIDRLAFIAPTIGERVFVLGFPKIPMAKCATLTIQHGEVTSEPIDTTVGGSLFLFSAFARPGNSGGPVINRFGQIVGVVSDNLISDSGRHDAHFAGVPCQEIIQAVEELETGAQLLIEDFQ